MSILILEDTLVTPNNMLESIITAIGSSISTLVASFAGGVGSSMTMFWDTTLNTGAGGLTTLGNVCVVALCITFAVTILYKVFDLLTGFFKMRG